MIKADFHNHFLTSSKMERVGFNKPINRAVKRLGEGAVMGLVNFEDKRYEKYCSLDGYTRIDFRNAVYVPEKQALVVKGQEIQASSGEHILVLGLEKDVHLKGFRTIEDTLKEAKDNNGIIIADHPFHKHGIGFFLESHKEFLEFFDAIEVHNGLACFYIPSQTMPRANAKAHDFFNSVKEDFPMLGQVISSDGHSVYEIGSSWMHFPSINLLNSESILDSIKKGLINSREYSPLGHEHNSYVGALDHMADLYAYILTLKISGKKLW